MKVWNSVKRHHGGAAWFCNDKKRCYTEVLGDQEIIWMGPANEFIDAKRTRLKAKAKKNLQSFAHIEAFVKKFYCSNWFVITYEDKVTIQLNCKMLISGFLKTCCMRCNIFQSLLITLENDSVSWAKKQIPETLNHKIMYIVIRVFLSIGNCLCLSVCAVWER